jgi:hypothetical protein
MGLKGVMELDKIKHLTPVMRRKYNGAKKDEIGRRKAVWEIEMDPICERYGVSQFLWEDYAPGICREIAEGMKGLTKDGRSVFVGDIMELDTRRNGSSRKGFFFGGPFSEKSHREAVHKIYFTQKVDIEGTEKWVLRMVGPPSLERGDVSYLTRIPQQYITKRA